MKNSFQLSFFVFIFCLFNFSLSAEEVACDQPPTGLRIVSKGHTYFHVIWDDNHSGHFQFRIRPVGGTWEERKKQYSEKIFIQDLKPCTEYELQVQALCSSTTSGFSESLFVTTNGCNDEYCLSYGLTSDRHIRSFSFNDFVHNSGNDRGYGDYTKVFSKVVRDSSYDIRFQSIDAERGDYFKIWIDLNQDNDFEDEGELVKNFKVGSTERYIYSQIHIPVDASVGITRMRISISGDEHAEPCDTRGYREVEDYTLIIEGNEFKADLEEIDVHYDSTRVDPDCRIPTGFKLDYIGYSYTKFDWDLTSGHFQLRFRTPSYNKGKWVYTSWSSISERTLVLDPCTEYEVQVRRNCDGYLSEFFSKFSESIFVTTKGCDDLYCYSYGISGRGGDWGANWIERFKLNTINNNSGHNGGYANFTNQSTTLEKGNKYDIDILPGYFRYYSYTNVWIDYNQDNDFNDEGELAFQGFHHDDEWILGEITVPTTALNGPTRMRVSIGLYDYPNPCDTKGYRDVEDYTVIIQGEVSTPPNSEETESETTSETEEDTNTETENNSIFTDFPWLTQHVDTTNCTNVFITVYDKGGYSYIFLEQASTGQLFFEDGTLYCTNATNYNCVAAYQLTAEQITATWACPDNNLDHSSDSRFSSRSRNTPIAQIQVFPNPATSEVSIQLPTNNLQIDEQQIVLLDITGKILHQVIPTEILTRLDVSTLASGLYLVQWITKEERKTVRLVVE